jgi:alanyl-tRNA synthetase
MTIKLYEENVYLKQTTAKIIERIHEGDKKLIVLDKTLFFPEGGGQKCDLGQIGSSNIVNVFIKNNEVYHEVDSFPEDEDVLCTLNWERRVDHMQQHCGEHILSGVFLECYNLRNKGFHLGEDYVTVDMDTPQITKEQIDKVELLANQAIWANHPIEIKTVMSKDEANLFPLRKIPDVDEEIRIVLINSVDTVACCGTHPSSTGEVGMIKILKWQKNKGMTRVFFKCGDRALKDYQQKHQLINQMNVMYSADVNTLLPKIEIDNQKKRALMDELAAVNKKLSVMEAKQLINDANNKIITHLYEGASVEILRLVGNIINDLNEGYICLLGSVKNGTIILSHDGNADIDCGKIVKENIPKESAKGGGSKTKAQVVFTDSLILRDFFKSVHLIFQDE